MVPLQETASAVGASIEEREGCVAELAFVGVVGCPDFLTIFFDTDTKKQLLRISFRWTPYG